MAFNDLDVNTGVWWIYDLILAWAATMDDGRSGGQVLGSAMFCKISPLR